MATLKSPGVDVQIIDESMYDSAGPGTVPLFIISTRNNKPSPTGVGIAPGTVKSQANVPYMITSARELIQTFGNPNFVTVEGTSMHGNELNEYGLHAAYQYLGVSSGAYVIRSDVDINQLEPTALAPRGLPHNGTYWFDLNESNFGIFQSNGNDESLDPFTKQHVIVVTSLSDIDESNGKPVDTIGENGDFAIVTAEATNRVFEKLPTNTGDSVWFNVGSRNWILSRSIARGKKPVTTITVGNSFNINNVTITLNNTNISLMVDEINQAILNSNILSDRTDPTKPIPRVIASYDSAGRVRFNFTFETLFLENVTGKPLEDLGFDHGSHFTRARLSYAAHNHVPQDSMDGDVWIKTTTPNGGAKYVVKLYQEEQGQFITYDAPLFKDDSTASSMLGASVQPGSLYIEYNVEGTSEYPLAGHCIKRWTGSEWEFLSYDQDFVMPTTDPEEGTMWYNTDFKVDIMVCDGDEWIGYKNYYPATDPNGVILNSAMPTRQSDDSPLVDNDLWLDTKDLENYPALYRYTSRTRRWVRVDNTDQTTPYGILFQDARSNTGGLYDGAATDYEVYSTKNRDLVKSNYLDPDAPDPRTFAKGCLLFNTRVSTYNVKEWKPEWFKAGGFDPNKDYTMDGYTVGGGYWNNNGTPEQIVFPNLGEHDGGRWVTVSGNKVDGSPYMGRKAQRAIIVRAMQSTVASNEELRSELMYFNLMACPGYPELIDEMVLLNVDKKEVAFIVGDTPARMKPTGNEIISWSSNGKNVPSNGEDGLTTNNPYLGIYYPWGLTTNVDGMEVMIPPSTIAMRTYAYNDSRAYPWFAPAGYTRGLVTNAASVGYLNDEGEYQPVILNQGQRDLIYEQKINPIAFMVGRGLVVYGQKTRNPFDSAMDRVNVARLTNYMKYHLDNIAKPFLFEQNDYQTRDAFRVRVERFLTGLIGLRALEDFVVICDESNNTPERRDRNELWLDALVIPIKAVEFIYIPVRIRNSGDSLTLEF